MINWMFYPKTVNVDETSKKIIEVFNSCSHEIDSEEKQLSSNEVLNVVHPHLSKHGFLVETSKQSEDKINVPVLFGKNGKVEKSFEADAYHPANNYVIEVEAGRAVTNYQFLKDFFEACVMSDVEYLCIAVRNTYRKTNDFEKICTFFDLLYQSNRMNVPLKGLLVIGY